MTYEVPTQTKTSKLSKEEIMSALGRRERRPELRDVTDPKRKEELLKEIEQEFFLQLTDSVISYKAILRNLSPINPNIIFFIKSLEPKSPTDDMLTARLGYNIIEIEEEAVTKEQRDTAVKFLADGFENTLNMINERLEQKKCLTRQESRIVENFNKIKPPLSVLPEKEISPLIYMKKLFKERFSAKKDNKKHDPRSIEYREDTTSLPGLENINPRGRKVRITVPQ